MGERKKLMLVIYPQPTSLSGALGFMPGVCASAIFKCCYACAEFAYAAMLIGDKSA